MSRPEYSYNGREFDAAIAESLFGYQRMSYRRSNMQERRWVLTPPGEELFDEVGRTNLGWAPAVPGECPFADALRFVPFYSSKFDDAWQVMAKIQAAGLWVNIHGRYKDVDLKGGWFLTAGRVGEDQPISSYHNPYETKSLPWAICGLALNLMGMRDLPRWGAEVQDPGSAT